MIVNFINLNYLGFYNFSIKKCTFVGNISYTSLS